MEEGAHGDILFVRASESVSETSVAKRFADIVPVVFDFPRQIARHLETGNPAVRVFQSFELFRQGYVLDHSARTRKLRGRVFKQFLRGGFDFRPIVRAAETDAHRPLEVDKGLRLATD